MGNMQVAVVIPVYNEEENLPALMQRLMPVMLSLGKSFEIIFIDDGSHDQSLQILKEFTKNFQVRVVELTKNYGQHAAIMAGFSITQADIIITMDADLQNPPEEIINLVKVMEEGNYDVVGTIRKGRKDSFFRILPSKIINMVARKITGVSMRDWGCMLRCYRLPVVQRMIQCHEHATFIPAWLIVFAKRVTEIEVEHEERHGGKSNYPLRKLINLQFDLVGFFFGSADETDYVRRNINVSARCLFWRFSGGGTADLWSTLGGGRNILSRSLFCLSLSVCNFSPWE